MSAKTSVYVKTETRGPQVSFLTMSDLRTFVDCWFATAEFTAQDASGVGSVEPVVMTEAQGGRFSRITAELPT